MTVFPIRNDNDLERALARVEELWGAEPGTPEGDELDVWMVLVEVYESEHHKIPIDPIDAIRYRMEALGWSGRELERQAGLSRGRASELLNRKRDLTLSLVHKLAVALGLPPGILVGDRRAGQDRYLLSVPCELMQAVLRVSPPGSPPDDFVVAAVERALCAAPQDPGCGDPVEVTRFRLVA